MSAQSILHVENLSISYRVGGRWIRAVRDFGIDVQAGAVYGIVGESGSGKSTVARALLRYLPANGRVEAGSRISFMGVDLYDASQRAMQDRWGAQIGFVSQNPGAALNPSLRIGGQVGEVLRRHTDLSSRAINNRVIAALEQVNLADAAQLMRRYPHELSGGQQQRVIIAMALITQPRLLILDEPTTALDVTTEALILDLVRDLIEAQGTAAIYVTHNLGVVAQLCDRAVVMYAGEVMEDAAVEQLYGDSVNPYTIGLLNSIPQPGQTKRERPLQTIPGTPPALQELPSGCVYAARCPLAIDICRERPALGSPTVDHLTRCWRWEEIAGGDVARHTMYAEDTEAIVAESVEAGRDTLLNVAGLVKHFPSPRSLTDIAGGATPPPVRAVDGVNITVRKGRTYGLVGESGSGKTTLGRMIIGLTEPTSGEIMLMGADLAETVDARDRATLTQLQMVFQNPQNTLNPYLTIGQAIRRPLMQLAGMRRAQANAEVTRLLQAVNLRPEYANRYPDQLSGGEKQRVAIARAFATNPALVVCDEPVSSLDVSVQAAVLNLLARLQEQSEASYIFISHDLSVVQYLADYIAVMYLGQIFEVGYARDLAAAPMAPYTEALVAAIPIPDPAYQASGVRLTDTIPSARDIPTGCRFHPRCPRKIGAICEDEEPPWRDDGDDHFIRCHYTIDELIEMQSGGE